ncbi:MAG: chemotaxis protein CheA [Thermoplasmata archaeon]
MDTMEYLDIYLEEGREILQTINHALISLEKEGYNADVLNTAYRAAHTLKGNSNAMAFNEISELIHKVEDVFDIFRKKSQKIEKEWIDILFRAADAIEKMFDELQAGKKISLSIEQHMKNLDSLLISISSTTPTNSSIPSSDGQEGGQSYQEPSQPLSQSDTASGTASGPVPDNQYSDKEIPAEFRDAAKKNALSIHVVEAIVEEYSSGNKVFEVLVNFKKNAVLRSERAKLVVSRLGSQGRILLVMPEIDNVTDDTGSFTVLFATAQEKNMEQELKTIVGVDSVFLRQVTMGGVRGGEMRRTEKKEEDGSNRQTDEHELSDKEKETEHENRIGNKTLNSKTNKGEDKTKSVAVSGVSAAGETAGMNNDNGRGEREGVSDNNGNDINNQPFNAEHYSEHIRIDTVRVKSKQIDALLDYVGELMINNIRLNQIINELKHRELKQLMKHNSRLMSLMQERVLRMRMVPLDFVFNRFIRLVRDVSRACGKEVSLFINSNEIEIDRNLIDNVSDALVHLIKNAIDHGIEARADRLEAGKPPVGRISLNAKMEKKDIVIMVEDDGAGINYKKIITQALRRGMINPDEARTMTEKEVLNLIFMPGFSSAEHITETSGRGIGLDVVKSRIESIGGSVNVISQAGKGTQFLLKIPPTMSIIRGLLVKINGERYAIPLEFVREISKVTRSSIYGKDKRRMFHYRNEVIHIVDIEQEFGGKPFTERERIPLVIVEKGGQSAGLIIEDFIGQQEMVIKRLGPYVRNIKYFIGATILGDGRAALVLDPGCFMG